MLFKSDIHVHTQFCDASVRMEDFAAHALRLGYTTLGFSPHSPLPFRSGYAMRADLESSYLEKITELKKAYAGRLDILTGIEWDVTTRYGFPLYDYRIGSVHQLRFGLRYYAVDHTAEEMAECIRVAFGGNVTAFLTAYFSAVERSCSRQGVDVVGHFDLLTKFNDGYRFFDERDDIYREIALNALRRIIGARRDLVFEINTGAMFRVGKQEPYPAPFLLREMARLRVPVTPTSDAHVCEALGFWQDGVAALCRRCGFRHLVVLTKNGFVPVAL